MMKIIIMITLSSLLIAGCGYLRPQVQFYGYFKPADHLLNGHDWRRMNFDQKVFYLKGYGEGLRSGAYFSAQEQAVSGCREITSKHENFYRLIALRDLQKLVTQYYRNYPMLKEYPAVRVLSVIVNDTLQ